MKLTQYLSRFQVIELCSSSYLSLLFWVFPRIAVQSAGGDALWGVIGVILVGVFTGWVQGALNERFPTMTAGDYHVVTWGKWIGKSIVILYVPVYIFFNAMCICLFVMTLKSFLPNTPRAVLIVALCLVATRGAWHGIESLGRVASIVHPLTLFGVIAIFIFILCQSERIWIPHTVTSWSGTWEGIYHLFPLYLGINFALMLSPYYEHRRGKSVWYFAISAAAGGVAIVAAFLAIYCNLGPLATKDLSFSVPFVLQLVRLQGGIVERLGILIIIFATAYTTLFVSCHLWGLSTVVARIFNVRDDKYKLFLGPLAVMVAANALWFRSDAQAFELLDKYLVPLSWILLLVSPLCTLLLAMIRGLRTEAIPIEGNQNAQPSGNDERK